MRLFFSGYVTTHERCLTLTPFAMSLPASFRSSGGRYSEKVTVVGRPRLDSGGADAAGAAGLDGTRKRKAPFEPAVHLQPSKVVLKGTDDRRCAPKQISC